MKGGWLLPLYPPSPSHKSAFGGLLVIAELSQLLFWVEHTPGCLHHSNASWGHIFLFSGLKTVIVANQQSATGEKFSPAKFYDQNRQLEMDQSQPGEAKGCETSTEQGV